jgi:thioredoxin-like negative regulator of GroEL
MAAKDVALAGRFGVQSVPATVVLNRSGKPVGVNYGLVSGDIIASQLEGAKGG